MLNTKRLQNGFIYSFERSIQDLGWKI